MINLSDPERELIVCLMEEAGEVVQACSKILRHGPESYHPNDLSQATNIMLLEKELGDILNIIHRLSELGTVSKQWIQCYNGLKQSKLDKYLHGRLLG